MEKDSEDDDVSYTPYKTSGKLQLQVNAKVVNSNHFVVYVIYVVHWLTLFSLIFSIPFSCKAEM